MKLYIQQTRKDGSAFWTDGAESFDRSIIVDNIMNTIDRKHHLPFEEEMEVSSLLNFFGHVHVDTVTYSILETDV